MTPTNQQIMEAKALADCYRLLLRRAAERKAARAETAENPAETAENGREAREEANHGK